MFVFNVPITLVGLIRKSTRSNVPLLRNEGIYTDFEAFVKFLMAPAALTTMLSVKIIINDTDKRIGANDLS